MRRRSFVAGLVEPGPGSATSATTLFSRAAVAAVFLFVYSNAQAARSIWQPTAHIGATWNSNATNANLSNDVIGALQLRGMFDAERRFSLSRDDALFIGGRVELEAWPRFDRLNRIAIGPRVTWRHKFGLGAMPPVVSVELAGSAIGAEESARNGPSGSITLAARKRFNERCLLAVTHQRSRHDARDTLFDQTASETTAVVAGDLDERWRLTATARWRSGDVLSYATPPRPDLVQLARLRTTLTTFGEPHVAYRIDATSRSGAIAVSRAFSDFTSITLGYEYRDTRKSSLRYLNHLVSTTWVHQF